MATNRRGFLGRLTVLIGGVALARPGQATPSLVVVRLWPTCQATPAQWEGWTNDGRQVFVHYRHGCLQVGVGDTLEAAIDDEQTYVRQIGDAYDGWLTFQALREATEGVVAWPSRESRQPTDGLS